VYQGAWASSPDFCFWDYPLIELDGKTMGLIGFGRIGRQTARIARAFGMKVVYYNPTSRQTDAARAVTLDELLRESDVISLHCPLTEENEGLIDAAALAKMKQSAILINTARGPLINERDLANALTRGDLAAAALDVVSTEPIRPDNPLLQAPNCLITPHIAWASREARQRLMRTAADNLEGFLHNKPCNRVN
jgi:glycerate dehydrogenase